MPNRRTESRPNSTDRRTFPRPPLRLNLLLLMIAAATFLYAKHERAGVDRQQAILFRPSVASPDELNRVRQELADMELTKQQLATELDGRMTFLRSLEGEQFYLAIDTSRGKAELRLGKNVVRDMDVTAGPAKTITANDGRKWTFVSLKGGFSVAGKQSDYEWHVPDWVYAMKGETPPTLPRTVTNGLGKYVILLPEGYVIESPPPDGSPLHGPKPGSYEVPQDDLAAIWPRITTATRVYIF
jgi:hypothetical protein